MAAQNHGTSDRTRTRYQNWQIRFDQAWSCLQAKQNREGKEEEDWKVGDPNDIFLTDAKDGIEAWGKKIRSYRSSHRTEEFYDFQEFRTKLQIKLDGVDVVGNPERRESRCGLYDQLNSLTKNLEERIHPERAEECSECVQVKVVSLKI